MIALTSSARRYPGAAGGLESLPPGYRSNLPDRVDLHSEAHRQLFAAFMGGAHGGGSPAETEGCSAPSARGTR